MQICKSIALSISLLPCIATEAIAQENAARPELQQELKCSADDVRISVRRDDRIRGSAIHSTVLLDGKSIEILKPGGHVQFCAAPGEHIIGVSSDFFGGMGAQKRELAIELKLGKEYKYRVFILHAQGATIERTAE